MKIAPVTPHPIESVLVKRIFTLQITVKLLSDETFLINRLTLPMKNAAKLLIVHINLELFQFFALKLEIPGFLLIILSA